MTTREEIEQEEWYRKEQERIKAGAKSLVIPGCEWLIVFTYDRPKLLNLGLYVFIRCGNKPKPKHELQPLQLQQNV